MRKLCVITGVAGDLGAALCNIFIKNNYEIFGIDKSNPLNLNEIKFCQSVLNEIASDK